jgi:hypothetical protein
MKNNYSKIAELLKSAQQKGLSTLKQSGLTDDSIGGEFQTNKELHHLDDSVIIDILSNPKNIEPVLKGLKEELQKLLSQNAPQNVIEGRQNLINYIEGLSE